MDIVMDVDYQNPILERVPLPGFYDDFNRPDNDALGLTSREARPWEYASLGSSVVFGTRSRRAQLITSNSGRSVAVIDALTPDGTYEVLQMAVGGSMNGGPVLRYTNLDNFIRLAQRSATDNRWALWSTVAGAQTLLAETSVEIAANQRITIICDGPALTVSIGGNVVATGTESRLSGTKFGFHCASAATEMQWDNISLDAG